MGTERRYTRLAAAGEGGAEMQPTRDLMTEHRAIERMLAVLDTISGRLEAGEAADAGHLEQILEFIRVFADRCHHAKEEDLLFVAMERAGIPAQGGPIAAMLADHEVGRRHVRGIAEGLAAYREGEEGAARRIAEHARGYAELLRGHIAKEDGVLYPLADRVLTQEQQRELEEGFERIERDVVGEGRHEAFHRMLDELERVYRQRG